MNAAELGRSIFDRRRPALSERQVAVRLTSIDYHDWRLLALDGLTEALQNDGLTEAEIAAASALVGSGYFGRSTAGLKDLLSTATIVSAA